MSRVLVEYSLRAAAAGIYVANPAEHSERIAVLQGQGTMFLYGFWGHDGERVAFVHAVGSFFLRVRAHGSSLSEQGNRRVLNLKGYASV